MCYGGGDGSGDHVGSGGSAEDSGEPSARDEAQPFQDRRAADELMEAAEAAAAAEEKEEGEERGIEAAAQARSALQKPAGTAANNWKEWASCWKV
jgi:hypothetical protein